MSNTNFSNPGRGPDKAPSAHTGPASSSSASSTSQGDLGAKAGEAVSKIGEIAKEAAHEAKRSATTLASEANEKVKTFMDHQLEAGGDLVGHMAASARVAAEDLDRNAPQLAALVRDAGRRMEQFSREIHGQSVDQLVRRASYFARQRPAAMFGAAAACGFFLFRLFKAGTSRPAVSRPGVREHQGEREATFGGSHYQPVSPALTPRPGQFHGA